jgi:hypothetical protein
MNAAATGLPPLGGVDQILVLLADAGDLSSPAEAAATVVAAHQRHPDAVLTLMVSGYDDDEREIPDIPEAREFYAGVAEAIGEYPCAEDLVMALDSASATILAVCAGWIARDQVVFVREGDEA